jgi:multiple sugar transport system substrate-binding protein
VGGIDLKPQLVTRHAAGDPYSFVENDWGTWTDLAEAGAIIELSPFYKKDKIDPVQTFIPRSVEVMSLDGKIYGLPVSVSADALAYNLDLFDAAGVKYPPVNPDDKSWTMEAFLEVAQKLTNPPQSWGFSGALNCFNVGGVTDGTYFGMPAWDDSKKKALMDTPEFRRGLQYFLDLLHRYKVQPTAEEQAGLTASLPRGTHLFLTGKIAMAGFVCSGASSRRPSDGRWPPSRTPAPGRISPHACGRTLCTWAR